jgi:hypothetical protein
MRRCGGRCAGAVVPKGGLHPGLGGERIDDTATLVATTRAKPLLEIGEFAEGVLSISPTNYDLAPALTDPFRKRFGYFMVHEAIESAVARFNSIKPASTRFWYRSWFSGAKRSW